MRFAGLFLVTFCLGRESTNALIATEMNHSLERLLSQCIVNISRTYFNTELPTAIQTMGTWYPHSQSNIFNGDTLLKMLSTNNYNSLLTLGYVTNFYKSSYKIKTGSYIIIVKSLNTETEINMMRTMLLRIDMEFVNPRSYCVIAVMESFKTKKNQNEIVSIILSMTFHIRLLRTIVLIPNDVRTSSISRFEVFSWIHNEQDNICALKLNKVKYIDSWIIGENRFALGSNLFPPQTKIDLKKCIINIVHSDFHPFIQEYKRRVDGVAVEILKIFCKNSNCRISFNGPNSPHMTFPVIYDVAHLIDADIMTYPYFRTTFLWFIPAGAELPQWQCLIRTFSNLMWVFVFITFITGAFTLWLIQKAVDLSAKTEHSVVMTILITHLGASDTNTYKGFVPISFFCLWLFYCLLINTAYQSGLFGVMVQPGRLPALESIQQLKDSKLKMKTVINVHKDMYHWAQNHEMCNFDVRSCFKDVAEGKHAILYNEESGHWTTRLFRDRNGKNTILPLKETVGTAYFGFYVGAFSYTFHNYLDSLFHRTTSAGLIDKWTQDRFWRFKKIILELDREHVFAFSLFHLQGAFYVLLFGLKASFVAFLIEVMLPHFQQWY
ncbi:Ionotropic receptor 397 [Blattella germanica]|nr:Ionotropic receptor 397 [Blattella germanica]